MWKNENDILKEIDTQIKRIKSKNIKPSFLFLGFNAYFNLNIYAKKNRDNFEFKKITGRDSEIIFKYKNMRILVNEIDEGEGIVKESDQEIKVLGFE
jgi:hypothetical protein